MLTFSLCAITLHNVVVVMGSLEGRLHTGKLMLNAIELHTGLLARLSDLSDRFFGFTKFQVDTLMLIRQLLGQSVLQTGHERL